MSIRSYFSVSRFAILAAVAFAIVLPLGAHAGPGNGLAPPAAQRLPVAGPADQDAPSGLNALDSGDQININVYGQPDMGTSALIGDDGKVDVPLAGPVKVAGLTAVDAAHQIERALKAGQFLVNPQVTVTVVASPNARVSILGDVRNPGRFPFSPRSNMLDLLAQAGGILETGSYVGYVIRRDATGNETKLPFNASESSGPRTEAYPKILLQSGDTIFIPKAPQFYIYGEINKADRYRVEARMTVTEAIAKAGGITVRGSERRVDIKRLGADGKYVIVHAKPNDPIQPDDVLRVKESIF
jgi:polysaccharide biosynthesis/export protein